MTKTPFKGGVMTVQHASILYMLLHAPFPGATVEQIIESQAYLMTAPVVRKRLTALVSWRNPPIVDSVPVSTDTPGRPALLYRVIEGSIATAPASLAYLYLHILILRFNSHFKFLDSRLSLQAKQNSITLGYLDDELTPADRLWMDRMYILLFTCNKLTEMLKPRFPDLIEQIRQYKQDESFFTNPLIAPEDIRAKILTGYRLFFEQCLDLSLDIQALFDLPSLPSIQEQSSQ